MFFKSEYVEKKISTKKKKAKSETLMIFTWNIK